MPQPAKKRLKREQDIEEEPDLTAELPDEILCHVLSFLPLRGKLRSEAVNHRFQRCILYLLNNKPQRLAMGFDFSYGLLNGYKVPLVKFANAVKSFANKAKFTKVTMDNDIVSDVHTKRLNSFFSALITSKNDCLSSLTTFSCNRRCTLAVLEELLAKCDKLSTLKLDNNLEGVTRKRNKRLFAPDLATALSNKGLVQLELGGISDTTHPQMLQLFRSLKPQTLKKLGLCYFERSDIVGLVKELRESAWAALEEIRLNFWEPVRYTELILSLSQLPSLLQCEMHLHDNNDSKNETVSAMVSVFNKSIDLKVNCFGRFFDCPTGCQIVPMIHQIQTQHPAQMVFRDQPFTAPHLMLKHGHVSFDSHCNPRHCIDANCVHCNCFYPIVLGALRERARQRMNAHLENYQLDQCRIDNVVKDIWEIYIDGNMWKALATNINEVNRTVEITFGWRWNRGGPEQFNISLGYGPCFST